jgi:aldehyde dehydrogenase (NAD+)
MATAIKPRPEAQQRKEGEYNGFDKIFIAGRWRAGKSGKVLQDTNPYNGETLTQIPQGNAEDLDEAYRVASKAQKSWAEVPPSQRSKILLKAAQILEQRKDEVGRWIGVESGGTTIKQKVEVEITLGQMYEAASMPSRVAGAILPSDIPGKEGRVYRRPVGVVGVISPWNFPLNLSMRSVAPALAVGNAVVLKPAGDTPVTGGLIIAKIFEEAGLPEGVLSVIVGAGSDIGDAFVCHPVPRVISFTGSTPVGRRIAENAYKSKIIKKLSLELGGNGPFVVLDDADLDLAVKAAVYGKFMHQGQICMITNRIIVDVKLYDEFVDRFADRVRKLKSGDPMDPSVQIGPIINKKQLEGLQKRIEEGRQEGARLVVGGEAKGQVLPPQVFADVRNDMSIAQNELFGPVAPIIRAQNEEDALRIANDTEYGLSSAVWTRDLERGVSFARKIEAGMTHVNDTPVNDLPNQPFGGEKNSGIGRFNGHWILDEFTTDHWITVQHTQIPYPF